MRGLSPYPCAWTILQEKNCKIYATELLEETPENPENQPFLTDNKKYLYLKTGNGFIAIKELQLQGKKRLTIEEFLRGNKL